tara:strand:- start:15802 stop:16074 length:273 start_codon:yes stop_codon:yes gene_type:complete
MSHPIVAVIVGNNDYNIGAFGFYILSQHNLCKRQKQTDNKYQFLALHCIFFKILLQLKVGDVLSLKLSFTIQLVLLLIYFFPFCHGLAIL